MRFDKIIMNPPYGKLANKCITKALKFSNNVVDLSPILFLQWPHSKEYETCGFFQKIVSIDRVSFLDACKVFCRNPTDLGIITLNNSINSYSPNPMELRGFDAEVLDLYNKIYSKMPASFKDYITKRDKPLENFSVIYSHLRGLNKNHNWVYQGNVAPDGLTYKEHVKNQHKNETSHHFEFLSLLAAENFLKYIHSDFFKFSEKVSQPGLIRDMSLLPFMVDYSFEWTEEKLVNYFKISEKELKLLKCTLTK